MSKSDKSKEIVKEQEIELASTDESESDSDVEEEPVVVKPKRQRKQTKPRKAKKTKTETAVKYEILEELDRTDTGNEELKSICKKGTFKMTNFKFL